MTATRLFLSQETLDNWLSTQQARIDGEVMTLLTESTRGAASALSTSTQGAARRQFRLVSAVHFTEQLTDGEDRLQLLGKVKDHQQLQALNAELCAASVIIGEDAYNVMEGFAGEAIPETSGLQRRSDNGDPAAAAAQPPADERNDDSNDNGIEMLARFLLKR